MADNLTILNSASTVVTMRTRDNGGGIQIPMSIPTNLTGTAMIGASVSASSVAVVIATDQSTLTTVIAAGAAAIGTVSALQSGAWSVTNAAGANAIGTVTALQGGNWVIAAGAAAIGTVSALQSGAWTTALSAGTQAIGTVSALQSGAWSVVNSAGTNAIGTVTALQGGNWVIAAGSNAIGTVSAIQSGVWTTQVAGSLTVTSNTTIALAIAALSTNPPAPVAIKNNTGTLVGLNLYNNNTTLPAFLKVFNVTAASYTAGSINAGTFSAIFCCGVPPGARADVALPLGTNFTTALSYVITRNAISNDTTAVATNDLVGMLTYY